jgi:hypothetical protein
MERWQRGEVVPLLESECMELVGAGSVGRFAYTDDEGPVVIPVNYAVADGTILVATSPLTELARYASSALTAFEVDEIDVREHSGWSVLLRGRTEVVDYDELPSAYTSRPAPWADGVRTLYLRLVPTSITGRRLMPA